MFKFGTAVVIIFNVEVKISPMMRLVLSPNFNIDVIFKGASMITLRRNGPTTTSL